MTTRRCCLLKRLLRFLKRRDMNERLTGWEDLEALWYFRPLDTLLPEETFQVEEVRLADLVLQDLQPGIDSIRCSKASELHTHTPALSQRVTFKSKELFFLFRQGFLKGRKRKRNRVELCQGRRSLNGHLELFRRGFWIVALLLL